MAFFDHSSGAMTLERAWLFADTIPRIRTTDGLDEVEELARTWLLTEPHRSLILGQLARRRAELVRYDPSPVPARRA